MDYQFENLGPEKFQQFCQALLVKEFPKVQCFPVAQPDGGRDAIVYFQGEKSFSNTIIFQVKFLRKPLAETNPHQWLLETLEKEAPKVKRYIKEGNVEYFLLTNIPGTAHPSVGSIDKVNNLLRRELGVPVYCWWRDDLNRRLDNAWNLKWAYPELMTGHDMLRQIIEQGLSEGQQRRTSAIRSFLRAQFDNDQEVRFKQVELQNKLLDLFIDVPIRFSHGKEERKYARLFERIFIGQKSGKDFLTFDGSLVLEEDFSALDVSFRAREFYYNSAARADEIFNLGAAMVLLHPLGQEYLPQIVLEGAPGQGKSTLTQYICQVHRMYILGERDALEEIPTDLRPSSIRIPFKVDLRDLATWLNKQNPFSSEDNNILPTGWHKSLEAFLAFQVNVLSGGFEFTVADLHAIAKLSSILLVLDGLDEVADIVKRKEIVTEVKAGINRLRGSCASLQVIITSRPAAFANSPGFPANTYPHFELGSITQPQIFEYLKRWSKARRLNNRDSADVKRILTEKLNQPHLRDLARNPMQLAILLSLIHARGSSLPDKRTALYDNYVELFFSRESEKSAIVREYRDLLIDIHMYLAWILHSEAELGKERGSISSDRLQNLLKEYLVTEGHDSSLAEKLFSGMVERVVVLVSRVQGTYEFEVQPLREYFVARFLYETAPYSPPGAERKGTKPDRFDAIAKNFYWLNVTRFYAGCFSKGELPALVYSLEALTETTDYRNTSHPRTLAAMLLSDWVFTQNQKAMREVIKLILDGIGLRTVLVMKNRHQVTENSLVLPKNCGKDELLERCFAILQGELARDYALELLDLIKLNATSQEIKSLWYKEVLKSKGRERTKWIEYGLHLEVLPELTINDLDVLFRDDPDNISRLALTFRAKLLSFCESTPKRTEIIINAILNSDISFTNFRNTKSILAMFSQSLDVSTFEWIGNTYPIPTTLADSWMHASGMTPLSTEQVANTTSSRNAFGAENFDKCVKTLNAIIRDRQLLFEEWKTTLNPWDNMLEELRSIWGEQWIFFGIANLSALVNPPKEVYQNSSNILDHSISLCKRVCYAKSKANSSKWWLSHLNTAKSDTDYMFILLILFSWGNINTLIDLAEIIDPIFNRFSTNQWERLVHLIKYTLRLNQKYTRANVADLSLPNGVSERIIVSIGLRIKENHRGDFYLKYLMNYQGSDRCVLDFCQDALLHIAHIKPSYWEQALAIISENYTQGVILNTDLIVHLTREMDTNILPLEIAKKITETPEIYPRRLVIYAEVKCREALASKIIPVGDIAKNDDWFSII